MSVSFVSSLLEKHHQLLLQIKEVEVSTELVKQEKIISTVSLGNRSIKNAAEYIVTHSKYPKLLSKPKLVAVLQPLKAMSSDQQKNVFNFN